jgi:3-hydroxybutyryl-CoA dehydrogenase
MTKRSLKDAPVLVVGAGIMGAGIAQVAAQAGHPVQLFDARPGAAQQALRKLGETLDGLVAKGKFTSDAAEAVLTRIKPLAALEELGQTRLVVEAIIEDAAAKRAVFLQLETLVGADCVLATNTSSISVTAIANGLEHPERLVGMHFFNPVPQMKLVEVVSGLQTEAAVAAAIFDLAREWGKTPVHARSTPGFIVNRIARPYYAETLALLLEQAATPQVLDACMRAAGFRMGPCELMDLIGHDTNFAVTQSVYQANFFDKRFGPSLIQREMVEGGLLGRKSGRGFYRYPEGVPPVPLAAHEAPAAMRELTVHGAGAIADFIEQAATRALASKGLAPVRIPDSDWVGLSVDSARLVMTDGRTAAELAADLGTPEVAVFDRLLGVPSGKSTEIAFAVAPSASQAWRSQAAAWLAALGLAPLRIADCPGLVVARTVAMLINEAADAVQQGVCTPDAANAAMKLGVNYPAGPFEWLSDWSAAGVIGILDRLDGHYRGERYRVSPWLRRAALAA